MPLPSQLKPDLSRPDLPVEKLNLAQIPIASGSEAISHRQVQNCVLLDQRVQVAGGKLQCRKLLAVNTERTSRGIETHLIDRSDAKARLTNLNPVAFAKLPVGDGINALVGGLEDEGISPSSARE